jgi:hypothetical protein
MGREKKTICNLCIEARDLITIDPGIHALNEKPLLKIIDDIQKRATAMENRLFKYRYAIAGLGFKRVEK